MLFGPAGTLKYWPGWVFTVMNLLCSLLLCAWFYNKDPQVLERRLLTREKLSAQKWIMQLAKLSYGLAFMLPGFDFRLGWTNRWFGPMPGWFMVLGLSLVLAGYLLMFWVLKANRFAASVIQVEAAQPVVSTGPYQFVRHPLYSGSILVWLGAPLALGSWVSVPAFGLIIPILILRLLHEEKFLGGELPGYADYCRRTRCRLVPGIW